MWSAQRQLLDLRRVYNLVHKVCKPELLAKLQTTADHSEAAAVGAAIHAFYPGSLIKQSLLKKYLKSLTRIGLARYALDLYLEKPIDAGTGVYLACSSFDANAAEKLALSMSLNSSVCLQLIKMHASLNNADKVAEWRQKLFISSFNGYEANQALKSVLRAQFWDEANTIIAEMTSRNVSMDQELVSRFVHAATNAIQPSQLALMLSQNPSLVNTGLFSNEPLALLEKGKYKESVEYVKTTKQAVQVLLYIEKTAPHELHLTKQLENAFSDTLFMLYYSTVHNDRLTFETRANQIKTDSREWYALWRGIYTFYKRGNPVFLPYASLSDLINRTKTTVALTEGHIRYICLTLYIMRQFAELSAFAAQHKVPDDVWKTLKIPAAFRTSETLLNLLS